MKANVERGNGFRGALDYAAGKLMEDGQPASQQIGGNMAGTTPRELSAEFAASRRLRPDAVRPVWHTSLSLPPGEAVDNAKWAEIARRFMETVGMGEGHQWTAFRHSDTDKDHIHIVASRINLDGSLWHGKWEARVAIEATQELEKEFDLTLTPGLEGADGKAREKKRPSKNEIERSVRTGEPMARTELQEIVDNALSIGKQSIFSFIEEVEKQGAVALPSVASTGKMNGFSFSIGGVAFKASQLGKNYSWRKLQEQGVIYEQARDSEKLIAEAQRIKSGNNKVEPGAERTRPGNSVSAGKDIGRSREDIGADAPANGPEHASDAGSPGGERRGNVEADIPDPREPGEASTEAISGRDQGGEGRDKDGEVHRASRENRGEDGERTYTKREAEDIYNRLSGWYNASNVIADLAGPINAAKGIIPRHIEVKQEAWREQHAALKSPAYRITAKPRQDGKTINFGKNGSDEILFTAAQVESMIPQLSQKNAMGYDIYVTPLDPNYHYLVVDDMTKDSLDGLKQAEVQPCLVQLSSENNYQAIIKADRVERPDEQSIANNMVLRINKKFGDENFSGAVHPFRMAGFSNKKPGRNNVFTKIVEAFGKVCDYTSSLLDRARKQIDAEKSAKAEAAAQEKARVIEAKRQQETQQELQMRLEGIQEASGNTTLDEYRKEWSRQLGLAKSMGWKPDYSVIDFRAAMHIMKDGADPNEAVEAIIEGSPLLSDRHHSDPLGYARRTVNKACERLERQEEKRQEQAHEVKPDDTFSP